MKCDDCRHMEALELAWGLIANAHGGDWDSAPAHWKKAAERWRDEQWHEAINLMPKYSSEVPAQSEQNHVQKAGNNTDGST